MDRKILKAINCFLSFLLMILIIITNRPFQIYLFFTHSPPGVYFNVCFFSAYASREPLSVQKITFFMIFKGQISVLSSFLSLFLPFFFSMSLPLCLSLSLYVSLSLPLSLCFSPVSLLFLSQSLNVYFCLFLQNFSSGQCFHCHL